MPQFGELLRRLRRENGLTQEEVARSMRASKSYVSGIENGKVRPPSPRIIRRLTRLFQYDEREMLRLACVEKAPQLIRGELESLMFPQNRAASGDMPVVPVPLLNSVETGYSARLTSGGAVAPLVNVTMVVPRGRSAPACAITVCDDSMKRAPGPSFERGDIVLLTKAAAVTDGAISYLVHGVGARREAAFRRTWLKQGSRLALEPLNGQHPGAVIRRDTVEAVFLAVGAIRVFETA